MRVRQPKDLEGVDTERGTHPVVSALAPDLARIGEAISAEGQAAREHADRMIPAAVAAAQASVTAQASATMSTAVDAIHGLALTLCAQVDASSEQVSSAVSDAASGLGMVGERIVQAVEATRVVRRGFTMRVNRDAQGLIDSVDVVPS